MALPNSKLTLTEEQMRAYGLHVLDMVIDHHLSISEQPVGSSTDEHMLAAWLEEPIPMVGTPLREILTELDDNALSSMTHFNHPRAFAFVPSPGNYISALADFIASSYNIFAGAWLGPSGVATIEMKSIAWLKEIFCLGKTAGGLFVSGGSMANLTALAVARHVKLSNNPMNASIYFSDQTHSSVPKALKILGFQPYQIRKIPSDDEHRLSVATLSGMIDADRKRGLVPFCIVANGGTTNTGAVDPIDNLATYCEEEGLWLHVDGAYGGAAILVDEGKRLLTGIERADSITIDPHKWLFQPYEIGCVLVRNKKHLEETFKVSAEYLEILNNNTEQANYCDYGVQLTRGFRALKFWMSLKYFGLENFKAAIERGINHAHLVQSMLEENPFWKVVTPAQLGVINFCVNQEDPLPKQFYDNLSRDAITDGFALLTPTQIKCQSVLRICSINPRTTKDDLRATLIKLEELACNLLAERAVNSSHSI